MKRVIAFLLILTIPVGLILGAHKAVDALRDDVTVQAETLWGDPALAEGLELELLTTCGNHMYWTTSYTAGETETDTEFFFTQDYHGMDEWNYSPGSFNFYITSGMGMSTSGGRGFELGDIPLGRLASAVAEKTEPGQTHTELLNLADYVDVYPMEYWSSIVTGRFVLDEQYDSVSGVEEIDQESGGYKTWMELFQFPVETGAKMEVTVGKTYDGAVVDLEFHLIDGPEASFISVVAEDGMYFAPVFRRFDGTPIETGRFPQGYGIYYIPMTYADGIDPALVEEGELCAAKWDFENLKLVYPLNPGDDVAAMSLSEDGTVLHLIFRQENVYRYCAMDAATGEVLRQTEILTASAEERYCDYAIFEEEELLFLSCGVDYALVDISADCGVEFTLTKPEGMEMLPLPERILYREGKLCMTAKDWYGGSQGFALAVLSRDGVGYYGIYSTNLHETEQGYGSSYVNLEKVEFAQ